MMNENDERNEYRKAWENLSFSPEAKERMVRSLMETREAQGAKNEAVQPKAPVRAMRGGKRRWRYVAAVAAAAMIVLAVGGGAYASGALMSMANVFDDVFGGAPAQTEVVDKIGRPIGASATSNGVTITAEAVIGDQKNYVIVFSIAKDDGTALDVEPDETGTYPLGFMGSPGVHVDGVTSAGGSAYFYDSDPSDNAIQYAVQMSVDTLDGSIIGKTARVELDDLYAIGSRDEEARTVAEGTWKMKFELNYEDTSIDLAAAGSEFDLGGMRATLDSATLSPIALTLEYTVDAAVDWEEQESGRLSEHNQSVQERFLGASATIAMKDGSSLEVSNGAGGWRVGADSTACHKNIMFDEFLNLDEVSSVTIGGVEIPLP